MAADAATLRCPQCGAVADPDARRCRYCHARLATVSCPSCFALMFDGAAYCPKCGARHARSQVSDAGAACPACKTGLDRVSVGETALLECPSCDGVWVDATDFEKICADREAQAAVLHRLPARSSVKAGDKIRYRPCLRCGKMMNRVNFGRVSGAVVDVCRGHGTFLDAGELHQIVSFIQGGGLERVRKMEIQELREEQKRLSAAQRAAHKGAASTGREAELRIETQALGDLLRSLLGK